MTGRRGEEGLPWLDYSKVLRHSAWYGRYWKPALRLAGVPESVRFHDPRHGCATWMLNDGVPLKDTATPSVTPTRRRPSATRTATTTTASG
jgi:integrase